MFTYDINCFHYIKKYNTCINSHILFIDGLAISLKFVTNLIVLLIFLILNSILIQIFFDFNHLKW